MKKSVILVLVILFISSFSLINVNAEQKEITYIVVFDEAHLQFFTYELMNTAITSLNDTFDTDIIDITIDLVINDEAFTSSKLQGADLVIIPSPNLDENKITNAVLGEKSALTNFMGNGGGVLYMANPYSANNSIASHSDALTRLVSDVIDGDVMLGTAATIDSDNNTIIVDDDNNDGNNTHIYFDQDNIQSDSWKGELNEISSILYYGAALDGLTNTDTNIGNSSKYAYAINNQYVIKKADSDGHRWVTGNTVGTNDGRGILIGSTIMFSDYPYNNSLSWVDVEDNLALFQNLVAWLLKITPLNIPQDQIDHDFSYFLTTNILFSIFIPFAFIALVFGIMLRSKSITFSRIFDFKVKRKKVTKKDTKETKKATKKTTKKATKKTRRKRT